MKKLLILICCCMSLTRACNAKSAYEANFRMWSRFIHGRGIVSVLKNVYTVDVACFPNLKAWKQIENGTYMPVVDCEAVGSLAPNSRMKDVFANGCKGFHPYRKGAENTDGYVVLITCMDESSAFPHEYVYLPSTGELGWSNEWVNTPPQFGAWLNKQTPRPCAKPPTPTGGAFEWN